MQREREDTALAGGVQGRRIGQRRWTFVRGGASKQRGFTIAVFGKA